MKWKERVLIVIMIFAISILLWYRNNLNRRVSSPVIELEENILSSKEKRNDFEVDIMKFHEKHKNEEELHPLWYSMHAWDVWQEMVQSRAVTAKEQEFVDMILKSMVTSKITSANVGFKGTQLKAMFSLEGPEDQLVVFKPRRYDRDKVLGGTPYEGYDRHNAEIAAFHLDRILGFYRAPPSLGRFVDLQKEVKPVCQEKLMNTFFQDGDNTCFYGVCMYCEKKKPACGNGSVIEGSLTLWLPTKWKVAKKRHPWQRTYRDHKKAKWEIDPNYCDGVIQQPPYNDGPRLLDIMDTAIFDFLIGNADRHHYEYLEAGGDNGMLLHMDNGKSFGNPFKDELSILAPIYQCCRLRKSTYERLLRFSTSSTSATSLSAILSKYLKSDPIYPILTRPHLEAIDRRLKITFDKLNECFTNTSKKNVLIEDNT